MIITTECTIDLDEKRRIWNVVSAEGDGEPSAEMLQNMSKAATEGALDAYNKAKAATSKPQQPRAFKDRSDPDRPKPIGVK